MACYLTYNSVDNIEQSLNSIIDLVDFVVSVDGALLGMPLSEDFSYDGTNDIVKRIAGKRGLIIQPRNRLTEVQSRNLYAELVRHEFPNAWMFSIDSDEVLHDALNDFEWLRGKEARQYQIARIRRDDLEPHRKYGYHLHTSIFDRTPYHPRFYSGIPGLHYAENHWALRDQWSDRVEPKYGNVNLAEAWLEHRRSRRSRGNLDATNYYNIYQRWKYEKTERPLTSYLPYPLLKITKNVLFHGKIPADRFLKFAYGYTLGSRSHD